MANKNEYAFLSDVELIALLKSNDQKAFEEIYHRYWKKIFAVASNKLDSLHDAEEIVQDIFTSLWNRRISIEITSSLSAYLAVSVNYRVIKNLYKKKNQQRYAENAIRTIS